MAQCLGSVHIPRTVPTTALMTGSLLVGICSGCVSFNVAVTNRPVSVGAATQTAPPGPVDPIWIVELAAEALRASGGLPGDLVKKCPHLVGHVLDNTTCPLVPFPCPAGFRVPSRISERGRPSVEPSTATRSSAGGYQLSAPPPRAESLKPGTDVDPSVR